ncbi:MAG: hypothetical protein CFE23_08235 [Flavobacterium sp. BFFFF1]|nr:MAG: hypothetical protein CFE23_08235 [Flavobacterium sp. BFFFF1]
MISCLEISSEIMTGSKVSAVEKLIACAAQQLQMQNGEQRSLPLWSLSADPFSVVAFESEQPASSPPSAQGMQDSTAKRQDNMRLNVFTVVKITNVFIQCLLCGNLI